jgi:hypothetical protein
MAINKAFYGVRQRALFVSCNERYPACVCSKMSRSLNALAEKKLKTEDEQFRFRLFPSGTNESIVGRRERSLYSVHTFQTPVAVSISLHNAACDNYLDMANIILRESLCFCL